MAFVISLQLGMDLWQLIKYLNEPYRGAFGWGVVLAKTSAGVLYPDNHDDAESGAERAAFEPVRLRL